MSESEQSDGGPGRRETAYRLFATEYDDAAYEYSESDEERAPNYVVTPTGARVNRLFVGGVLTTVESVNEETVRARVVDPTGAFVIYAGQYQPEALAFFERADPPAFVAVTGKANTFQPDGSDRVLTSLRPEQVTEVDADTRDRWVVTTAEQTLERIGVIARAIEHETRGGELESALRDAGVDGALASGIPRALEHYGTTADYLGALREVAIDALEVVADRRDEVRALSPAPEDDQGEHTAAVLAEQAPAAPTLEPLDSDVTEDPQEETEPEPTAETAVDSGQAEVADTSTSTETTAAASTESTEPETVEATAGAASEPSASGPATETTTETEQSTTSETESTAAGAETTGSDATAAEEDSGTLGNFEPGSTSKDTATENADQQAGSDTEPEPEPVDVDADTDPEELYEIDDEEREEIESEYGVEFSSGTEVDEPGEADIDVPATEGEATAQAESAADTGTQSVDASAGESDTATDAVDTSTDESSAASESAETPDEEPTAEPADTDSEAVGDSATEADDETATDEATTAAAPDEDLAVEDVLLDTMDSLDDGDGADREAVIEAVTDETGASEDAVVEAIDDALMSGQCYEPDETTLKPI